MAVDWRLPAPVETEKQGAYLHDRSRIPEAPPVERPELARRFGIVIMGVLFTIGLAAMAFTTLSAWDNTRDLAFVMNIGVVGIAGVGLAYLVYRGRWDFAAVGIGLAVLTLGFIGMNAARAYTSDGPDIFRDVMTVLGAITLGVLYVYVIAATIVTELKDPTHAPEPEM